MVITSSRLANGTHIFPPSLITKWRTRVARTQLEFTAARDREFVTSSRGQRNVISPLTSSRVEWNAALVRY